MDHPCPICGHSFGTIFQSKYFDISMPCLHEPVCAMYLCISITVLDRLKLSYLLCVSHHDRANSLPPQTYVRKLYADNFTWWHCVHFCILMFKSNRAPYGTVTNLFNCIIVPMSNISFLMYSIDTLNWLKS